MQYIDIFMYKILSKVSSDYFTRYIMTPVIKREGTRRSLGDVVGSYCVRRRVRGPSLWMNKKKQLLCNMEITGIFKYEKRKQDQEAY